jgi:hypothetical protein
MVKHNEALSVLGFIGGDKEMNYKHVDFKKRHNLKTLRANFTLQELDEVESQLEHKAQICIRILTLRKRERACLRALHELRGEFVGGYPLPDRWKEEDWLVPNVFPTLDLKRSKDLW